MEVVRVADENYSAFMPLMTERMQIQYRIMEDVFVLGAIEEDTAAGVIGVQLCADGGADILYLFVSPEYRRRRLATELIYSAAVVSGRHEEIIGLRFNCCENLAEESGLLPFFQFCEFDITENEDQVTYYCEVRELESAKLPKRTVKENIVQYKDFSIYEKKLLKQEPPEMVSTALEMGLIEPELSCCLINSEGISDVIVMVELNSELIFAWGRASENGVRFIALLEHVLKRLKEKYNGDKRIIIPATTGTSCRLCQKLLGNIAKPIEKSFEGVLMLDQETEE